MAEKNVVPCGEGHNLPDVALTYLILVTYPWAGPLILRTMKEDDLDLSVSDLNIQKQYNEMRKSATVCPIENTDLNEAIEKHTVNALTQMYPANNFLSPNSFCNAGPSSVDKSHYMAPLRASLTHDGHLCP